MRRGVLALYRVRGALYYAAAAALVANWVLGSVLGDATRWVRAGVVVAALLVVAVCAVLTVVGPRLLAVPAVTVVASPVRGRWLAVNSPASNVPSHGVRAYGQAYAIDLVHDPVDGGRPQFGDGPAMRAPQEYPAFGQPVHSMVDGVVVRVSRRHRDHRARSSWPALVYLMVEGALREVGGPGFILGNHVTVRTGDGVYATVVHLSQGSPTVRVGDRVRAGDVIGRCGNSGNSSEPHVHAQLMDRASPWTGQGLPMAFQDVTVDDGAEPVDGLPENERHMVAATGMPSV